ncbi:MAG: flagellar basal body protein, partial [Defluviitaleaceae bacterium]|nr:flagellar basal body protein [Defluviitaleaceae bacterium]
MPSMGSLSTAVSGLNAAQLNLYVTGHNLGNSKVQGFTRQQVMQSDFHFRAVGRNAQGLMQVGMGTNIEGIRQIRDRFLDQQFRLTMPRAHYMQVRYATGLELASIFGELEGQYRLHSVLRDLNAALHELSIEPGSLEARGNFLTFAESFIDKMNNTQRS